MILNELKLHGTEDFPFELYKLTEVHPRYVMAFHWHTNVEMVRVLEGELVLTLDSRTYKLKAGDAAFINSEVVHGATPNNCTYDCIVFNMNFLKTGNIECDEFIDSLLAHNAFLFERPSDKNVLRLLNDIFDQLQKINVGTRFKVIGLMQEMLGEILLSGQFTAKLTYSSVNDQKKVVKLKSVLKFIRENFAKDITLDEISLVSGLSAKYLCKFFKDMTGTTPVNYLMAYRIERATRKLLASDASVTQIAYDCGFNDLSYFIKTFKAYKKVTPKEYRNISRNM